LEAAKSTSPPSSLKTKATPSLVHNNLANILKPSLPSLTKASPCWFRCSKTVIFIFGTTCESC
jgi:hypothetical protein